MVAALIDNSFQGAIPRLLAVGGVFRQEDLKGRSRLVISLWPRKPPSKHASRATALESYARLHLVKRVSHMEPDSASMTAWIRNGMTLQGLDSNRLEVSCF